MPEPTPPFSSPGTLGNGVCESCGTIEDLRPEDIVACPDPVGCYVRDFEEEGLLGRDDAITYHVHLAHPFYLCRSCRKA